MFHYIDCRRKRALRNFRQAPSRFLTRRRERAGLWLWLSRAVSEGIESRGIFLRPASNLTKRSGRIRAAKNADYFSSIFDRKLLFATEQSDIWPAPSWRRARTFCLLEPGATLRELLGFVNPGGLLFVEGPLETNPSPEFWAALLFSVEKRLVMPNFIG